MKKLKRLLICFIAAALVVTSLPLGALKISASASAPSSEIVLDAINKVDITAAGQEVVYAFTPAVTDDYRFEAIGSSDICFHISSGSGIPYSAGRDSTWTLYAGTTYTIKTYLKNSSVGSYTFTLSRTLDIIDLELVSTPYKMYYIKGFEDFSYDGLKLRATLENGTTVDWNYNYLGDFYLAGYEITIDDVYLSGHYTSTKIYCGGKSVEFSYTILANPVKSIELVSGKITCILKSNGIMSGSSYYYYYDVPDDVTIKINYTDSSYLIASANDYIDGYGFEFYDNQESKAWVLGENESINYVMASYLGAETKIPVSVIKSPIRAIAINSAPTHEYVYGDLEYGLLYTDGTYELYPLDVTGLSFTVYYNDGSTKTYTDKDIDENGLIDGYSYDIRYDGNFKVGTSSVVFEYLGKTASYNIVCKNSPIKKFSIKKFSSSLPKYYLPYFIGMEIELTYDDNSTKVVTVTEDNIKYNYNFLYDTLFYTIEIDGYLFTIETDGSDYYFIYLGKYIQSSSIVKYEEQYVVKSIEPVEVSCAGNGLLVDVNYKDGTKETLFLDTDVSFSIDNMISIGYAKTTKGLLHYYVQAYLGKDGRPEEYYVNILGKSTIVKANNTNGWVYKDGNWLYYVNGVRLRNDWAKDSSGWCYLNKDGKIVKNQWLNIGGDWYFVNENGYRLQNCWKQDSKGWVYLGSNGKMVKSNWVYDGGNWYYVNAGGYMVTSQWMKDSKGWCYLASNGKMVKSSWIQDGGAWYYINGAGYMVSNQWMQDSKGWCYLTASGKMATNAWIRDSKGWCYVGANGYCVKNQWMKDSKGWVYLNSEGRMATNCWMRDSKGWCYLGADGYAVTNSWRKDTKGWCYLDANGRMVINSWLKLDGKWYYLDGNGYMVTGTKTIGGKTYKFDSNGVWIG